MVSITGDETAAAADASVVKQKMDVIGCLFRANSRAKILHLRLVRDVGQEGRYAGILWRGGGAQPAGFRHVFLAHVAHGHVSASTG